MPKLTFNHLTPTKFEEFTFDLLHQLKFVNIDWRKGTPKSTSPADRGRDIVAQQVTKDIDESTSLETWFVDCKHFKKAVPPTELQNLLTWAEAERPDIVLFVVSGYLSNSSKDYLESYKRNNHPPFKIKYWELPQLERLTRGKVLLLRKHNVTDAPIRNVKAIMRAEEEFFDRVWHDRQMLLLSLDSGSKAKTPSKLLKGMILDAKRVRQKYGKTKFGPYSDFEWGMINGKLSALRWVLGGQWDMLDT